MEDGEIQCSKCKTWKGRVEFWTRKDRKKGVYSKCKSCCALEHDHWRKLNLEKRRRDLQEWRTANPEKIRKLYRDSDTKRRNTTREWLNGLKNVPCVDCGKVYNAYVMDFDHRVPTTKRYTISWMASKRMPQEAIQEELKKCDIVCSNCHRERTFARKAT